MGGDNEDSLMTMSESEDADFEDNWEEDICDDDGDDNWGDVAVDDTAGTDVNNNWDNDVAAAGAEVNNWDGGNVFQVEEEPRFKRYFEQSYLCYPISYIGKPEDSNRIIMPQSALDHLASLKIQFPMIFQIKSHFHGEPISHCGVLEFTAEEGYVFMPNWMMKNLQLETHELVKLKSTKLSKGTYLKLQPHQTEFIMLQNPKEILERALTNFACLTKGDTFMISENGNEYLFDVLETEPGNAISVVETDCVLDFEEPLDYKEVQEATKRRKFTAANNALVHKEKSSQQKAINQDTDTTKFKAFTGASRRLG